MYCFRNISQSFRNFTKMLPLCKHIFLMQKILVQHQGTNALCELGMQEKLILYEDVNLLNHGSNT